MHRCDRRAVHVLAGLRIGEGAPLVRDGGVSVHGEWFDGAALFGGVFLGKLRFVERVGPDLPRLARNPHQEAKFGEFGFAALTDGRRLCHCSEGPFLRVVGAPQMDWKNATSWSVMASKRLAPYWKVGAEFSSSSKMMIDTGDRSRCVCSASVC